MFQVLLLISTVLNSACALAGGCSAGHTVTDFEMTAEEVQTCREYVSALDNDCGAASRAPVERELQDCIARSRRDAVAASDALKQREKERAAEVELDQASRQPAIDLLARQAVACGLAIAQAGREKASAREKQKTEIAGVVDTSLLYVLAEQVQQLKEMRGRIATASDCDQPEVRAATACFGVAWHRDFRS